jgi:hypothetical protein
MEIRQSVALFWFDCRTLEFFKYPTHSRNPNNNFGDRFCRKDCGLCPYSPSAKEVGGLKVSLYEAAQNFELFSNIQDKNLNQKPIEVDVYFKAYPMVLLSV